MPRILIMAGEASGDHLGAQLARALKSLQPNVELLALGGQEMQAAGVQLLKGIERLDIIGMPSLAQLRKAVHTYRSLSRTLQETELDAVVLIDNPGLNLRLARVAKKAGHRVIYYVAPQIWAWREGRIKIIKRYVDQVLVILPFEEPYYRKADVPCRFVGHPMMDDLASPFDLSALRRKHGIDAEADVVGLFPGSREREVRDLLPTMLEAAKRLIDDARQDRPRQCVLAQAPSVPNELIDAILLEHGVPVTVIRDRSFEVMALSDAAIVASGTATLQTAVIGTPMVIVYRVSWLTYRLASFLAKVDCIGLANLVAGRPIATELVQRDFTVERVVDEVRRLLNDAGPRQAAQDASRRLRKALGSPGTSLRAAEAILEECGATKSTPSAPRSD